MSGPKTTVKETTPDHIVFGPGVATINLGETGTRELGMTAGGSTWNVVRTKREIAGDGLLGPTKGLVVRERVEARLTIRLKDITKDDIVAAIAGADISEDDPAGWDTITGGAIETTDYFTNVAVAAAYSSCGNDVIFVVENALPDGDFSMSLEDKGEGIIELVFLGHFDPATPTTEPWELRHPRVGT